MTTPTGMTLYTYDRDTAGRCNCNGDCTQYWRLLIASQDSSPTGNQLESDAANHSSMLTLPSPFLSAACNTRRK
jgi:hypothetical protein